MKTVLFILLPAILALTSCNNENKPENATGTSGSSSQADVKAHRCSAACKDNNHVYLHNEVGHTCDSACGKPHACGKQCKGGSHVYAHGEAGHYCTCTPAT